MKRFDITAPGLAWVLVSSLVMSRTDRPGRTARIAEAAPRGRADEIGPTQRDPSFASG